MIPRATQPEMNGVMKQVLDADVLIATPVTKSHSATGVSLAMKGMMGLIYDRREFHLNLDLDEAVVDLCTILRPTLTLIDASRVLTTGGPGGPGKVLPKNKVVASTDMVAADAFAATDDVHCSLSFPLEHGASHYVTGSVTWNVLPLLISLSKVMRPPCSLTTSCANANPMPVPVWS